MEKDLDYMCYILKDATLHDHEINDFSSGSSELQFQNALILTDTLLHGDLVTINRKHK